MICLAAPVHSRSDAEEACEHARETCDIVELRVDYCSSPARWLKEVIRSASLPVIVTDRSPEEGGYSPRDNAGRMNILRQAAHAGADYVDCEYNNLDRLGEIPGTTRIIGSFHDFKETPADPESVAANIEKSPADIVKVAFHAQDITDNFRLFKAVRSIEKPVIGICMGERGEISRIIGRKFGSFLTYAVLDKQANTAPGQIPVNELREMYRYHSISERTRVYGVAGNPIQHSASPAIHNAAVRTCGADAVYVKFLVDDIGSFMQCFRDFGFSGLSVTIPFKVDVMKTVDLVDRVSSDAGAVNTVSVHDGELRATNTDIKAAVDGLRSAAGGLKGKKVALLGAGGAARGICFGLVQEGADICVVNRTLSKAEHLARSAECEWCGYDDFTGKGYDILINTTPVGMHPDTDRCPVSPDAVQKGMTVFDIIYNPPRTKLIRIAEAKGCRTLTGIDMFIGQGEEQFRIWFGRNPPQGVMRKTFEQKFSE